MQGLVDLGRVIAEHDELGKLQPGGVRPDLILFPSHRDEPLTVDFASRIREARRRGITIPRIEDGVADASSRRSPHNLPSVSRALELGYTVSFLLAADDDTLGKVYELLEDSALR